VAAGRVLTRRYTEAELSAEGISESQYRDPRYVPVRGHLDDADRFDNAFFHISRRDAELTDPQHRLMLETAWRALEDAAQGEASRRRVTGVFASGSGSGYLRAILAAGPIDPDVLDQALHGTEPDFLASLIAYKLGLTGPALTVQTACSSSLVATHLAVQSLVNRECDQAVVVAGGIAFPQGGHYFIEGGIKSATGVCRPFDSTADGVVEGSGVACLVLRRYADALKDGLDPYGVILGSAINNDGSTKVGYNAPSPVGQESVIRAALAAAEVDASSVGYLETHGTGTALGDPIEWAAATRAYRSLGAAAGQIAVGATKANIGHLDGAAGLVGLIKSILVLKHGVIPPLAGFSVPNAQLETKQSPLRIPTHAEPWSGPSPRRAAVSAFGIGGTNVHVLIEEPPQPVARTPLTQTPHFLAVSAADPEALNRLMRGLAQQLAGDAGELADTAFTLAHHRAVLPERAAVWASSVNEAAQRLADDAHVVRYRKEPSLHPSVVFVFPGQGTQYPGMALPLIDGLPGFEQALETTLAGFDPAVARDVREALCNVNFPADALDETSLAQPSLFAVEHAAACALLDLGVQPIAAVGHSLGEIAALAVAGVLRPDHAARLAAERGKAMQGCEPGGMMTANCGRLAAEKVAAEIGARIEIAAVNAPSAVVLSGSLADIDKLEAAFAGKVACTRLRSRRAFHSHLIDPCLDRLREVAREFDFVPPSIDLGCNASGNLFEPGAQIRSEDLVVQARRPVLFADCIAAVLQRFPSAIAIEVGPGGVLTTLCEMNGLSCIPLSPHRNGVSGETVREALSTIWARGAADALAASVERAGRPVHLFAYPFHGARCIFSKVLATATRSDNVATGKVIADVPTAAALVPPDIQAVLFESWCQHLGVDSVRESSDFFDLGGDSLVIVRMAGHLRARLGLRLSARDLLAARTFGQQAVLLRQRVDANAVEFTMQPIQRAV
jgi:acyl transferase domain-containing protein